MIKAQDFLTGVIIVCGIVTIVSMLVKFNLLIWGY